MDTNVYSLESRDFTEMEHALSAWDHQYRQISPGPFHGSILHTQTGSTGIFRNRWERAIHYRGVAPEGTIALAISIVQTGEARWMGQPVGFNDLIIQRCGMEAEYRSAPLWDSVVFTIPEVELVQKIADITYDDPWDFIIHGVARLTPQVATQVRQVCLVYLDTAAGHLTSPDTASLLPQMVEAIAKTIAGALVLSRPQHNTKQSFIRQRQLIKKVEDYCAHHTRQPLRVAKVCSAIDVSERSLRDAFHKIVNTSPLDYLKIEQLNRVRNELHDMAPGEMLIKQVAFTHGFSHLGQFSHDYKQLFGELPSETLRHC
jgi:AraC family ethanolamine operon transcriptional activator